jgi:hypothetical protein
MTYIPELLSFTKYFFPSKIDPAFYSMYGVRAMTQQHWCGGFAIFCQVKLLNITPSLNTFVPHFSLFISPFSARLVIFTFESLRSRNTMPLLKIAIINEFIHIIIYSFYKVIQTESEEKSVNLYVKYRSF